MSGQKLNTGGEQLFGRVGTYCFRFRDVKFLEDGSRIESGAPKTYRAKEIKKISTTHIIFVDLLGVKHEIKVVNPVGYDLRKIY